eukprot:348578-Pyramimonas_sp.AAC.1
MQSVITGFITALALVPLSLNHSSAPAALCCHPVLRRSAKQGVLRPSLKGTKAMKQGRDEGNRDADLRAVQDPCAA